MSNAAAIIAGIAIFVVVLLVFLYFIGAFDSKPISIIPETPKLPKPTGLATIENTSTPLDDVTKYDSIKASLTIPTQSPGGKFIDIRFTTHQYNDWHILIQPFTLTRNGKTVDLMPGMVVRDSQAYGEHLLTLNVINEVRMANNLPLWDGGLDSGDVITFGLKTQLSSQFMGTRINADGSLWLRMNFMQ